MGLGESYKVMGKGKVAQDECEVVKLVLSILKCVINTADDVDYLASFLALTNLDIDDVAKLRIFSLPPSICLEFKSRTPS